MNDIFTTTFEKHKKLLLESLNDHKWEEKADWSVFDTPEDTSKSFEKLLGISEAKNSQPTTPPVPTIVSVPTGEWWDMYNDLPTPVQETAKERYNLFLTNPKEPSLNFKPLQHLIGNYWSININANYRTIGIKTDIPNGFKIKWIFIGNHSQYDNYWKRLMKNKM